MHVKMKNVTKPLTYLNKVIEYINQCYGNHDVVLYQGEGAFILFKNPDLEDSSAYIKIEAVLEEPAAYICHVIQTAPEPEGNNNNWLGGNALDIAFGDGTDHEWITGESLDWNCSDDACGL